MNDISIHSRYGPLHSKRYTLCVSLRAKWVRCTKSQANASAWAKAAAPGWWRCFAEAPLKAEKWRLLVVGWWLRHIYIYWIRNSIPCNPPDEFSSPLITYIVIPVLRHIVTLSTSLHNPKQRCVSRLLWHYIIPSGVEGDCRTDNEPDIILCRALQS